jgi:acyl-CoA synthetase (AMP-forming)/AMP-acid ligase II
MTATRSGLGPVDNAFPVTRHEDGLLRFDRSPGTLVDAWSASLDAHTAPALTYEGRTWSYDEFHAEVARTRAWLARHAGVGPGDRVGMALRNYPEWIIGFWAITTLGASAVPLNAWSTSAELDYLLSVADPKVLVADDERLERIDATSWRGPRIAVRSDRIADLRWGVPADLAPRDAADVTDDQVATVMFTSGTTGKPKPVAHTHLNHVSTLLSMRLRAAQAAGRLGLETDERGLVAGRTSVVLLVFPLFHVAGLTLLTSGMYAGSHFVTMYKWNADEALELIEKYGVTEISGPPMVVQQLVAAAAGSDRDLSTLRSIGIGGSSASASEIEAIDRTFGGKVNPGTGYGMTETTSAVTSWAGADLRSDSSRVGPAVGVAEIRIVDEEQRTVPDGDAGEVQIRGPQVAVSGDGALSPRVSPVTDWFATGDVGRLGEDGALELVGRIKDVIIRGGENVYAVEVEGILESHGAVAEAAVVGRAHPRLGEEVVAVVRLRDADRAAPDLVAFAAERLASFKVPVAVTYVTAPLPRSAAGKLIKAECREIALVAEEV